MSEVYPKSIAMKTNRLIRILVMVFCGLCIYEGISELRAYSEHGRRGVLMKTINSVTKPMGYLFGGEAVKPVKPSDLDFPPQSDSLYVYKRMYADSVVKSSRE